MRYRKLGNSELEVSVICLGTMTYGTPVAEPDAIRLTRWAVDHGVNFIDTANMYEGYNRVLGSPGGVAEEILGKALVGRRDEVVIATKAGNPVGPGPGDKGLSRAHLMREIEKSLRRLRTDCVDIFYLHRPDPDTPIAESLAACCDLIEAGKTRHYGFSNYDADGTREILRVCDAQGFRRPVVTQPHYSLLARDAEKELLPLCRRDNIAVVPYRILQGGLLCGKYRRNESPAAGTRMSEKEDWLAKPAEAIWDELDAIQRRAEAEGLSMTQCAIRQTLRQPAIASVIVGVKRENQLEEAIAAASES